MTLRVAGGLCVGSEAAANNPSLASLDHLEAHNSSLGCSYDSQEARWFKLPIHKSVTMAATSCLVIEHWLSVSPYIFYLGNKDKVFKETWVRIVVVFCDESYSGQHSPGHRACCMQRWIGNRDLFESRTQRRGSWYLLSGCWHRMLSVAPSNRSGPCKAGDMSGACWWWW